MRALNRLAALAIVGALSGCASSAVDLAPPRPDRPWAPQTRPNGEIAPGAKANSAPAGSSYALPVNADLKTLDRGPGLERGRIYGLADLVDVAQSANPTTRMAWNRAKDAALAVGIARSAYLPRLTASVAGGYRRSKSDSPGPLDTSVETKNSARGGVGSVSLEWLLFDFGQRAAVIEAAEQGAVVSNIAFTAEHQRVIHEVALAFYAYNAARARARYATESLNNARAVEIAAESRLSRGVGTIVDAAQARQATAQAKLTKVQADGATKDGYLALLSAVGLSPLTEVVVSDISGRRVFKSGLRPIETAIMDALGRRPDVLAAYAAAKASDAGMRAAAADFLPKAFIAGTGSYAAGRLGATAIPSIGEELPTVNLSSRNASATVLAGVRMPLYDAGVRAAALKQAQTRAETAALVLTRTKEEAARQIAAADNSLRSAVFAYEAASALVSAAQTTFDAALVAYRNGVGSVTAATLAETGLLQAKIARVEALSASLSSAATLALAIGAIDPQAAF
ncbi:outer membrane protein TolC [Methylopila capsulata]|uniref:Protein CyaE n=1 Tax=Methylopila capsulata TaxID=61654 RepID=A0A9W6IPZ9_9HYPH|nr:TolC family protein [Methylopila capsulata]MBM7851273.1 outer membrane protein TolC [Methylopila capsulata]GLK54331.1 protein CyaE [Methylopila capsulata]